MEAEEEVAVSSLSRIERVLRDEGPLQTGVKPFVMSSDKKITRTIYFSFTSDTSRCVNGGCAYEDVKTGK